MKNARITAFSKRRNRAKMGQALILRQKITGHEVSGYDENIF